MDVMRDICIFAAGSIAIAILLREGHEWWLKRKERKAKEQRYAQVARDAVREAEEILRGRR